MGLGDGMLVGGGFFLGYFLAKWLMAIIIISVVMYCVCSAVARDEAKGQPNALTKAILKVTAIPEVYFKSDCAVRATPKSTGKYLGSVEVGRKYSVVNQRGSWRKIFVPKVVKGWTKCPLAKQVN